MWVRQSLLLLLWLTATWSWTSSIRIPSRSFRHGSRRFSSSGTLDDTLLNQLRSMRVKELKAELANLDISTQDVFEKEQLVERLYQARKGGKRSREPAPTTSPSSSNIIRTPLLFASLDSDLRIAAVNMNGGLTVNPSDQPYAAIQLVVDHDGKSFPLSLLLDTACSGFVLRPSVIQKYNLPMLDTPVTMTGAGGTVGTTGLSQLASFRLGGQIFGPLPASVQEIGALPSSLDGILGLSFLSQFSTMELNFVEGELILHRNGEQPKVPNSQHIVARGDISLLPLGIYTADVYLGNRGPVKMLVDSGAASTFLNWKGLADLGISRSDSSFVQRLSTPMGAMGSDNIAMNLTHRIYVSSFLQLGAGGRGGDLPGLALKGSKRLSIDIGDIAILDQLERQKVGGILGIDALARCASVWMSFQGGRKELCFLEDVAY